MDVNWLAIIVAAIVKFAIGAVWFTVLFGERWRVLMNVSEGASQQGLVPAMIVQIIGDLIMAWVLALIVRTGMPGLGGGILMGFAVWLGFVATIMVGSIFYEKKKPELVAIGAGYQLVGIVVMGAILGVWT